MGIVGRRLRNSRISATPVISGIRSSAIDRVEAGRGGAECLQGCHTGGEAERVIANLSEPVRCEERQRLLVIDDKDALCAALRNFSQAGSFSCANVIAIARASMNG